MNIFRKFAKEYLDKEWEQPPDVTIIEKRRKIFLSSRKDKATALTKLKAIIVARISSLTEMNNKSVTYI
jgi:hypothetical protein